MKTSKQRTINKRNNKSRVLVKCKILCSYTSSVSCTYEWM